MHGPRQSPGTASELIFSDFNEEPAIPGHEYLDRFGAVGDQWRSDSAVHGPHQSPGTASELIFSDSNEELAIPGHAHLDRFRAVAISGGRTPLCMAHISRQALPPS